MLHRPLFVSQCHHFSLVIYFIAISVSLPPPPPVVVALPSLFLHLRSPPLLPPCLLSPSFFHPLIPALTVSTNIFSLETLHRTTQHNSALLTLSWRLYYTFLSLSRSPVFSFSDERSSNCRFVFSFARVAPHQRYFDECAKEGEREEEREIERKVERATEEERARGRERER